jgi:putative FmdB family regulatory protein
VLIDTTMPTYEYSCPTCGSFDAEQRITEAAFKACPTCGSPEVKRLISRSSFALKGGGWYADGYKSTGPAKKASAAAEGGGGCGAAQCGTGACAGAKALN